MSTAADGCDDLNVRSILKTRQGQYVIYSLDQLEKAGTVKIARLPYSIRILLESVLRHYDGKLVTHDDVLNLAHWQGTEANRQAMPFFPGRVILQDFTGVPLMVDLAAMRSAMARMGSDPEKINPRIPVDLVIDHSVQVDYFGTQDALERNTQIEFQRNHERYEFLSWAQKTFSNLRIIPPASGIIHQVNLEYLASGVLTRQENGETLAFPDTLVGTDSHTTMINGLGVLGWGVGGIEAAAAMLGQQNEMVIPDVIGFKLTGSLLEGVTPTDLTLTITQILRKKGVVNKFVEYFGSGLDTLSLADRAMISNMSPENGATVGFFPVDQVTLDYLRLTGRPAEQIELVETYCKAQHLFREKDAPIPEYSEVIELDLATVQACIAGPKRPQERLPLPEVKSRFAEVLVAPKLKGGYGVEAAQAKAAQALSIHDHSTEIKHGSVVIAAITACTNTSDPFVMIGAGLVAKKALEKGLNVKPFVKTSLSPGSRVVSDYLKKAGLENSLDALGFATVGYGCMTCIGNSGNLIPEVSQAITEKNWVTAAVVSGNRNFEGRINPQVQANFLASPPLVVVYALAGSIDIDLTHEPIGTGKDGQPVYLRDIWPTSQEIMATIRQTVTPDLFERNYAEVQTANKPWNAIQSAKSSLYAWQSDSTYIQEPPYFENLVKGQPIRDIRAARALAVLGDSITTDHISPAGAIPVNSPAGKYLLEHGVKSEDFNSYGSRRGNDQVLTRGAFANIRLKNRLVPEIEGGMTLHLPDRQVMSIFDAAKRYRQEGVPLIVLAGKEYGTGSSRDWAAKGPLLLGVRVVIAESFERIHRSNLVGMGILPLQFKAGENLETLGLNGREQFYLEGLDEIRSTGGTQSVRAIKENGEEICFETDIKLVTPIDLIYFRQGGLMPTALFDLA